MQCTKGRCAREESEEGVRTDQEYRNLEAENGSLRERLEKAEKDADRWQYRYSFLQSGGAVFFSETGVTLRMGGDIIAKGATETEAIDAAIKAQQAAEIERERTARRTAQESLENYKGECTRLQHEVDRLKGEGAVDRPERA